MISRHGAISRYEYVGMLVQSGIWHSHWLVAMHCCRISGTRCCLVGWLPMRPSPRGKKMLKSSRDKHGGAHRSVYGGRDMCLLCDPGTEVRKGWSWSRPKMIDEI